MESSGTCPRGHAIEENAVYCTVCWVRLVPEDPEVLEARRRRRRRFRIPFIAASALAVGVAAGAVMAQTSTTSPAIVAAPATSAAAVVAAAEPTAAAEDTLVVTAQPEAATVADPVIAAEAGCQVTIDGRDLSCSTTDDRLVFEVCVPDTTALVEARTRAAEGAPWTDVSMDAVLGSADGCDAGQVAADVVIDAPDAGTGDATWRLVARDANGERVWKSRFVLTDAS